MAVDIEIVYEGDLRCRAVHGPSGSELLTDAPKDHEGEGRHFSPTDLTAAAVGTCVLTVMGIIARPRNIEISGARASVKKEMGSKPRRHISRIQVEVTLPASLDEGARTILEKGAAACPVKASLGEATEVELSFRYE